MFGVTENRQEAFEQYKRANLGKATDGRCKYILWRFPHQLRSEICLFRRKKQSDTIIKKSVDKF